MKPVKLFVTLTTLLLVFVVTSQTYADISKAAVLYLRIAPGARAAAMGEAYVAIVDDATATHWNPAGLGTYPLSDSWQETKAPEYLMPISAMASLKVRGGSNYLAYDIWAITSKGLVRFDNKNWYLYEVFDTKTNQTVEKIVSSYFNLTDGEKLAKVVEKVAAANNKRDYNYLTELKEKVLTAFSDDYTDIESLQNDFDSLLIGYNRCLINWDRVADIEKLFSEGMKDSVLAEREMDRISFAVEKSRNRFIPEELLVHYSTLFENQPAVIASTEEFLMIGSDNGLYSYNGKQWQTYTMENGLPSRNILTLISVSNSILVGTDKGIVRFDGSALVSVGEVNSLPEGPVTAIGASSWSDIWIVLNDELYHFDGENWSNSRNYTVVLDDTPEKIAEKFALYGTEKEKENFIEKLYQINKQAAEINVSEETENPVSDSTTNLEMSNVVDSTNEITEEAEQPIQPSVEEQTPEAVTDTVLSDEKEQPEITQGEFVLPLEPGTIIKVPNLAELKGDVNTIYVGLNNQLWLGTSYGLIYFDSEKWVLPGYREYTVEEGQSFEDMLLINAENNLLDSLKYRAIIKDINDLEDESVVAGQAIKLYRNPTAVSVNSIASRRDRIYFGTTDGLIEYDGESWGTVDLGGLDKANIVNVEVSHDELWFASDKKTVIKANGKNNISLMYVKWLPELADDLYYAFMSASVNKEGWGTFGGNITFISYGTINRTGETGLDLGTFESFDVAFTASYGTALNRKLSGGVSAKFLYSKLADLGAGIERGKGTSSGFAIDLGLLYKMNRRLTLGLAITNIGPKMAYIDAAQADPLPRNLALGFAYKLLHSDYYHFLVTTDINKSLVGLNDSFGEEFKQIVYNSGVEFLYANILALRAGYIHDQEGDIKTVTFGIGLSPVSTFDFDFSYIPSNSDVALGNTLRYSLSIWF